VTRYGANRTLAEVSEAWRPYRTWAAVTCAPWVSSRPTRSAAATASDTADPVGFYSTTVRTSGPTRAYTGAAIDTLSRRER